MLGVSQVVLVVKNPPADAKDVRDRGFDLWVGKMPWRREWQPTTVFVPGESYGQKSLVGYSSCTDTGAWRATAHGVAESGTQLKRLCTQARTHDA